MMMPMMNPPRMGSYVRHCRLATLACWIAVAKLRRHEYWKNSIKFEVVQKIKQGKAWIDTNTPTQLDELPLDFVAHAYPGGTTSSPFTDEFVILEHEVNSRKEHVSIFYPFFS
jgi:hypothetical protein